MNECVWSNGGMILAGEGWSTGRKTLYSFGGRWMNVYGAMVEWYWQVKTEVLGEKYYTVSVVDGWMCMEQWWDDTDRETPSYFKRNLSHYHFFTTNLVSSVLESKHSLRGERPATYRLSHGTANSIIPTTERHVKFASLLTTNTRFLRSSYRRWKPSCHNNM